MDYRAVSQKILDTDSEAEYNVVISNNTDPNLINTNNWVSTLPANNKFNKVVLLGNHDAGMSELHHCSMGADDSNTQTQKHHIKGHLESGSRFFDIRVDYDHDELVTFHLTSFAGCNGQSFKTVLEQTIAFLELNKSEVVILKISHIRGEEEDTKQRIEGVLLNEPYNRYLFKSGDTNLANLNLTEAAGKFVAVLDYSYGINPSQGMFRYHDGFVEETKNNFICDLYSSESNHDNMAADQISKWNLYAGLGMDYLFLLS